MYNLKAIDSLRWYCNIECVLSLKLARQVWNVNFFCQDRNANDVTKKNNLKSLYLFFKRTVPENIHNSPMVGIFF